MAPDALDERVPVPDLPGYCATRRGEIFGPGGKRVMPATAKDGYLFFEAFIGERPDGTPKFYLTYGTHAENMQDAVRHGTLARGQQLRQQRVRAIRAGQETQGSRP